MLSTARPSSFPIPFGANAGGSFIRPIPVNSQIGVLDGAASLNDGFVPDNFTVIAGGGVPPFGQDMNGILKQATSWCQWIEAGGPVIWDSTFSTAISGYPKGARVDSAIVLGAQWYSIVDGNATNPDDPLTSANWARVGIPAGMPMPFLTSTTPIGFVTMNALTIGNASSNAGYASADALFLFVANWLGFSNTQCPILTSGGAPTTRGANAVADFNANRQLTLPNGKGLSLIGVDTMGGSASSFLTGVPVTIGNATAPGSILGESLHPLTTAELAIHAHSNTLSDPTHSHNFTAILQVGGNDVASGGATNHNNSSAATTNSSTGITISNANAGSGSSHNTTHRSMGVYWGQKL
jgi:hypothetical protein